MIAGTSSRGRARLLARCRRWAPRALPLGVLLSLLAAAPSSADYRSSFREGIRAFDEERFEDAAVAFRRALSQRPNGDRSKISAGGRRISYVPNTMLALTLVRLGECAEARPYFEAATQQGVAETHAPVLHRQMLAAQRQCARSAAGEMIRSAESALEEARGLAETISNVLGQPGLSDVVADHSALARRAEQASEAVANAASLLEAGRRSSWFQALRDAGAAAETARDNLRALRDDVQASVRSAVAPLLEKAGESLESADARRATTRRDVERAGSPRSLLERLEAAESEIEGARSDLDAARSERDPIRLSSASTRARNASDELAAIAREAAAIADRRATAGRQEVATEPEPGEREDSTATGAGSSSGLVGDPGDPVPATSDPGSQSDDRIDGGRAERGAIDETTGLPVALLEGGRSYFGGDYQTALERLSNVISNRPEVLAQAALLRAAARFALYRLGGESEPELLEAVRSDLAQARADQPGLEIDRGYFPPPFVALAEDLGR